jgi:hypothetical protein
MDLPREGTYLCLGTWPEWRAGGYRARNVSRDADGHPVGTDLCYGLRLRRCAITGRLQSGMNSARGSNFGVQYSMLGLPDTVGWLEREKNLDWLRLGNNFQSPCAFDLCLSNERDVRIHRLSGDNWGSHGRGAEPRPGGAALAVRGDRGNGSILVASERVGPEVRREMEDI